MSDKTVDFSTAQAILDKKNAAKIIPEVNVPVDTRNVVNITTDCPIDTHNIVTMLCETLSLTFETVVKDHLYSIKVDPSNNEEIEEKCNELLDIYSYLRKINSTYTQRLNTQYSICAILERSSEMKIRRESIQASINYSSAIENGLNHLHSISKDDWINELTDYLDISTINATKESLKVYVETIFNEEQKLLDGKVFKGVLNNSTYALLRHPTNKRTESEKVLSEAFYKLDQKLEKADNLFNRSNTSEFECEVDKIAREKSNISKLSMLGFAEYKKADRNDEPTLEMSKAFPKFKGISTTGTMREDIFEWYTLKNLCDYGYSDTRMIARSVVNAAIAWYCAQNYKTMLTHIELCIENNASEEEVLSILK